MIYEGFYADECEITNRDWLEYEWWTALKYGSRSDEHTAVLPDTLVDRHPLAYSEPYVEYYYRHPAYRDYPVRGVSYEQTLHFCKWRTERVKEWYAINYRKKIDMEYRLPTKEEWELLSLNGMGLLGKNKKGAYDINCKPPVRDSVLTGKGFVYHEDIAAPAKSGIKNSFGLYHILGNMSEMVMEKGIAKGGNYESTLEDCRAGKDKLYLRPESWLGFRCVCVVKKFQ